MKKALALLCALLLLATSAAAESPLEGKSLDELTELVRQAEDAISRYHTISFDDVTRLNQMTKDSLQSMTDAENISWSMLDWMYTRDWNWYTATTNVTLRDGGNESQESVEATYCDSGDGSWQLIYMRLGDTVLLDE